jgi:hypothetical protein
MTGRGIFAVRADALAAALRTQLPDFAVCALDEALAGRNPGGCVVAAPNHFRGWIAVLFYLRHRTGQSSVEAFREVLSGAWECDHGTVIAAARGRRNLRSMFKEARFPLPAELPRTVQIWRGTSGIPEDEARRGASWTLRRPTACWFAMRFADLHGKPLVLTATVRRRALLYFSNGREEQEVVCFEAEDAAVDGDPEDWKAAAAEV